MEAPAAPPPTPTAESIGNPERADKYRIVEALTTPIPPAAPSLYAAATAPIEEDPSEPEEGAKNYVYYNDAPVPSYGTILWKSAKAGAYRAYLVADKIGEKVAGFLGITDSRFQYAVDEYNRQQEREAAAKARQERELARRRQRRIDAGLESTDDPEQPDTTIPGPLPVEQELYDPTTVADTAASCTPAEP
eukprot:NODE_1525_length_826_cov_73.865522_g1477_i0.p1 GENE.NODE_1525_length_826_cov_73.865522_g1477_i0~~NODE_1525_length_826_cov_73.865522_g1477_i0.p1  ORF type:complete len:191 (+),score=41.12 NODE_1525_length_826_cov_73.865522_g1477_i0:150-722(+)